jgi:cellulose biosynthesis protein BcsQ
MFIITSLRPAQNSIWATHKTGFSLKLAFGKTTTATNLALLLARMGRRVLAVDLAGGQLMAKALLALPEFANHSGNKVESREADLDKFA